MMSELEKFKRHMREPVEITMTNADGTTDKFKLMPLTNSDLIDYLNISNEISSKLKTIDVNDSTQVSVIFSKVPKETWDSLFRLLKTSVKLAYPELADDVLDEFVTANFIELFKSISKVNAPVETKA